MKRKIVAALVVFVACATILWAEDGPAKKEERAEDVAAKEKMAKEWLKFMEGEWSLLYTGANEKGKAFEEQRETSSKLLGEVLVSHVKRTLDTFVSIGYWDAKASALVLLTPNEALPECVPFASESDRNSVNDLIAEHNKRFKYGSMARFPVVEDNRMSYETDRESISIVKTETGFVMERRIVIDPEYRDGAYSQSSYGWLGNKWVYRDEYRRKSTDHAK